MTPEQLRPIDVAISWSQGYQMLIRDEAWVLVRPGHDDYPLMSSYRPVSEAWEKAATLNLIPHYMTDANAALPLMQEGWALRYYIRQHDRWWDVQRGDEDDFVIADTPAEAICKARFPELFHETQTTD